MRTASKNLNVFRILTLAALCSLVLEFVLGMVTSLFVEFPDSLVNGNGWAWAMSASPIIKAHVILGTLLVLLAISALIFGFVSRSRPAILWSLTGLVLTGLAYVSGSIFLSNVAEDNYSMLMALGFMGSMLAYGIAFYRTRP